MRRFPNFKLWRDDSEEYRIRQSSKKQIRCPISISGNGIANNDSKTNKYRF